MRRQVGQLARTHRLGGIGRLFGIEQAVRALSTCVRRQCSSSSKPTMETASIGRSSIGGCAVSRWRGKGLEGLEGLGRCRHRHRIPALPTNCNVDADTVSALCCGERNASRARWLFPVRPEYNASS